MVTLEEVIDECPYDTSTAMIDYCVNENLYAKNKNGLNELNDTGLDNKDI